MQQSGARYVILITMLLHNKKQFDGCNYIHRYLK